MEMTTKNKQKKRKTETLVDKGQWQKEVYRTKTAKINGNGS